MAPIQATSSRGSVTMNLRCCLAGMDQKNALRVAGALLEVVKKPVQIGIEHHNISASIGIVQVGRGHTTVDELLRCAHVALSRARKWSGRLLLFRSKMDAHVRTRALLEKDLREAIAATTFDPTINPSLI